MKEWGESKLEVRRSRFAAFDIARSSFYPQPSINVKHDPKLTNHAFTFHDSLEKRQHLRENELGIENGLGVFRISGDISVDACKLVAYILSWNSSGMKTRLRQTSKNMESHLKMQREYFWDKESRSPRIGGEKNVSLQLVK